MKRDVFDGSVLNGLRQLLIYSFILLKPPGYKIFCEAEILHFKKKSDLNTITFYLEDDDHKEINFIGETLNFTLKLIKV